MREKRGYTLKKIGDKYGIPGTIASEYLQISTLPDNVIFGRPKISKTNLYEISKLITKEALVKVFEIPFKEEL